MKLRKRSQIPVTGDLDDEPDETFRVTLSASTTAQLPADGATEKASAIGTIESDDTPTFSILSTSFNEDAGNVNIEVTLTPALSAETGSITYTIADGTGQNAATSADYTATQVTDTLNFASGVKVQTIPITIVDDTTNERNETFTITLSTPTVSGGSVTPVLYAARYNGNNHYY